MEVIKGWNIFQLILQSKIKKIILHSLKFFILTTIFATTFFLFVYS